MTSTSYPTTSRMSCCNPIFTGRRSAWEREKEEQAMGDDRNHGPMRQQKVAEA
ncbi:hypothetical protein DPMN_121024 [Dreissena polymorpha]|uniref:Uncharacterized protein n=1 Tax=Dreissena polymorpha TaxID=45954 RepID=A0A9D4JP37_DREPO|nr:hypothetical protein DPMN_121024 [Dreissena polymorpha]